MKVKGSASASSSSFIFILQPSMKPYSVSELIKQINLDLFRYNDVAVEGEVHELHALDGGTPLLFRSRMRARRCESCCSPRMRGSCASGSRTGCSSIVRVCSHLRTEG